MRHIWTGRVIGLGLLLVSFKACSLSGAPTDGQVIDEVSGKPVADAIVVITWHGNDASGLVHSQSVCYHVEAAITDSEGRYHTNAWIDEISLRGFFIGSRYTSPDAFKPGFLRSYSPMPPGKILVTRFDGPKEKYLQALTVVSARNVCSGGHDSRKNLFPMFSAIAKEASSIAETPEQHELARHLTDWASEVRGNGNTP